MPRHARMHQAGTLVHLISRFVNRAYRLSGTPERQAYLERLGAAFQQTDWTLLGYALMSNHVHLCALAGTAPPWTLMKPLHSGFAGWLNRYQRTLGPVFAQRYTAVLGPPHQAQTVLAYLHNNPVRAHLVEEASESGWTSHRSYLGMAPTPAWLDTRRGLTLCGLSESAAGRQAFDALVRAQAGRGREQSWAEANVAAARRGARGRAGSAVELCDAQEGPEGCAYAVVAAPGAQTRRRWSGEPADLLRLVEQTTGMPLERILSAERSREVVQVRRLAVLVFAQELGRPLSEIAARLGISAQAASALLRREVGTAERRRLSEQAHQLATRLWQLDEAQRS